MTRLRLLLLPLLVAGALGLAGCGSGDGAEGGASGARIRITDATLDWPANPELAAVRMRIHNDGGEADELVGASSDAATSSMVHRSTTDEAGRATMDMVAGLPVPARSTVIFEPGGLHLMLDGLTRELEVGDEVEITLLFRDAGPVSATARVVEPGSQDPGAIATDAEEASRDH